MEAAGGETLWDAFLDKDADLEGAPPGYLYCRLAEWGEGDDV